MTKTSITKEERKDVQATLERLMSLPEAQRLIAVGVIQGMALAQSAKSGASGENT